MPPKPLIITFAESGRGETVFIEFPDGKVGVVDACPSRSCCRPSLAVELRGRDVAFVCLTHPHKDHGDDILPLLKSGRIAQFWHSLPDIEPFVYFVTQGTKFRSLVSGLAEKAQIERAHFVLDVWAMVKCRKIECLSYDGSRESVEIGDVTIHFLAPDRTVLTREMERLHRCLKESKLTAPPDPNAFSLILAIEYAGKVVLLGADGLRAAWQSAYTKWRKKKLPAAVVLKVPHHGAKDAFDLRPANQRKLNCWDLCANHPYAIIFAGDFSHPDFRVHASLTEKTRLHSFFDLTAAPPNSNPLGLRTLGARLVHRGLRPHLHCKIVCEIKTTGDIEVRRV